MLKQVMQIRQFISSFQKKNDDIIATYERKTRILLSGQFNYTLREIYDVLYLFAPIKYPNDGLWCHWLLLDSKSFARLATYLINKKPIDFSRFTFNSDGDCYDR